ncbi:hypothetical protein GYH30_010211 [Glycine max]|uniref:Uncharacterized protein n=2 Tax=Glycine subgen. Soja TaxID=1462606 RepID=A0A0R0K9N8_SOYBN|nr:hypothetical protein JHK87_010367 [Glycine soja]KAH1111768.1 hypothetical protein GYH30_010211 [Glycine max]RZC16930.1 hypothetical protein D0Y65_009986 [Glycine soja]
MTEYTLEKNSACFHDQWLTTQTNTRLFKVLCPHSHTFWETSEKITHPITTPSQTRLSMKFLSDGLPKNPSHFDVI